MHNSKLIKILKTLSPEEFRLLKKFLRSPFYNYTSSLIDLYEILRKYYPTFESPKLKKEKVFERLFPNTTYNDKKMRHTLSECTLLVEEFLVALKLREEQQLKKRILTEAYGQRNVYDLFERNTNELIEELENGPVGMETHNLISGLHRQYYFHPLTKKNKLAVPSLNKAMQHLDQSFAFQKLKLSTEMRARSNYLQENYTVLYLESIIKNCEKNKENNAALSVYINLMTLFNTNDTVTFLKVKNSLQTNMALISESEQLSILGYLLNYSIPKVNSGDPFYSNQTLELYKIGLKSKLLIRNNRITDFTFTNIIAIGSLLKEFDWTDNFIEDYEFYLDENIRLGAKALGKAFLYFHQQAFSEVIEVLVNQKFNQLLHHLRSRSLQLRAFYELFQQDDSYYEFLISNTYAFEKFIRRNDKIAKSRAEGYLNLISYTRKLANIKIKWKMEPKVKENLRDGLRNEARFIAKKWMLEKVEEL